jgi:nitrogen PTS system EIIA component
MHGFESGILGENRDAPSTNIRSAKWPRSLQGRNFADGTCLNMTLADIIDARAILPCLKVQNKKQLLQDLSQALSSLVAIDNRVIFDTLMQREKLGSTGLGQGIAIPHGRLPSITRVYGVFAQLQNAIPFESVDGEPVDIAFALISPDHAGADHLTALARVSRLLRDSATLKKLRGTQNTDGLYAILTQPTATATAA